MTAVQNFRTALADEVRAGRRALGNWPSSRLVTDLLWRMGDPLRNFAQGVKIRCQQSLHEVEGRIYMPGELVRSAG